ncbi:unnamed protein product [Gongylonema pulchrum]|uniref:Secreted protein n=1 Tax=Gongylonema pulchrum TaxID=637853 RepID=A0A183DIN9_9BILA|nr:unnamed protein product [Gongylonema pulchrum]
MIAVCEVVFTGSFLQASVARVEGCDAGDSTAVSDCSLSPLSKTTWCPA